MDNNLARDFGIKTVIPSHIFEDDVETLFNLFENLFYPTSPETHYGNYVKFCEVGMNLAQHLQVMRVRYGNEPVDIELARILESETVQESTKRLWKECSVLFKEEFFQAIKLMHEIGSVTREDVFLPRTVVN